MAITKSSTVAHPAMKPARSPHARRASADEPPASGMVAPPSAYAAAANANSRPAARNTTGVSERA